MIYFTRPDAHWTSPSEDRQQKKEEPKEKVQETPKEEKEERQLPIPQDVKQLLMEELEGIESAIQDVEAIIADREKEKKRLETLYKHVVEVLGQ